MNQKVFLYQKFMTEDKKSVVVYTEWIELFEELEDDEAGRLIKHFFRYVNNLNPVAEDRITKLSFISIKQTLKRDLRKYENYINKQITNGKKGGRPKKEETQKTQKTQALISKPKKADSVNVSVNDNDNDIYLKEKEDYSFSSELLNDAQWVENICRINKLGIDGKIKIEKYLDTFNSKLISELDYKTNKKDFASHFSRWLAIELIKYNTNSNKEKLTGAEAFKNLVNGSTTNL